MADRVEIDLIVEAISKGFDKIEKDLKGVGTAAKESGDKAKQGSEGTKSFGTSLASLKTAAMGAAVVIGGALVAGLAKSIMAASDAEESMSKFNVVFKDIQGGPAAFAAEIDIMAAATGRSKNELYGMVAGLGDLFQPLGFGVDAAADLSLQMTQLAIDLSSFNNMSMDEALQRLQGTLIGSHENALAFGVVINENTLKAEMAANGTDKLTGAQLEQAKVQARLNLLMAGTTAAQGDAERTADGFANQVRAIQAKMADLAVEIGDKFLPIATELVGMLSDFADNVAPKVVAAAGFIADGLGTAKDMAHDFGEEVKTISAENIAGAETVGDMVAEYEKLQDALNMYGGLGALVTGTTKEMKDAQAELINKIALNTDSAGEFIETLKGMGIVMDQVGTMTTVHYQEVYRDARAMQAASDAAEFLAQSDSILTRGMTENTEAVTENVRVNEELADKHAQLAAQNISTEQAVINANNAINAQAESEQLAAEQAEALRAKTEELQTAMTGNFKTALEDTTGATTDWTQELFNQASQLGLTQAEMVLLAEATGNYTAEQIEAALQAAIMQEKVGQLAGAVANGSLSVEEALASLRDFKAELDSNAGATQRFIDKLNAIPSRIEVQIDVHGGEGITAHGGYQNPDAGGGSGGAATSGGGGTGTGGHVGMAAGGLVTGGIPGRDSVPAMLMPGERVLSVSDNRMLEQLLTTLSQQQGKTMNVSNNFNGPVNPGQIMREMEISRAMMGI